ncbi:MAG TPA: cold shock domain-containing protein [Tenericutes bacterium]|mgnify:FL=1|nr:cold shock domain-containing protein [Mycoplasmatota bacterium]
MQGKVKWFNNEKGFGFIEYRDGEDIFVHYSAIISEGYKTLSEGQFVEFELIKTDKGLQARNVAEIKTALV